MQRDDWNDMYSGHEEAWTAEPESVLVTEVKGLARIHRRTALGTALEEASGCSSESGIMVLEQKPARKLKEHPTDAATEQTRPYPHRL